MNNNPDFPEAVFRYHGIPEDEMDRWKRRSAERARQFLRTDRSRALYREVLGLLRGIASTGWAGERLSLLFPTPNYSMIKAMRERVRGAEEELRDISSERLKEIRGHLKALSLPEEHPPKYRPAVSIVAENEDIYEHLIEMGINRWCPIHTPATLNPDSELIVYVYDNGGLEFERENVVMVPQDSPPEAIVPEIVLSFFEENREVLEHALRVQELRGRESIITRVLELLESEREEEVDIREVAEEALKLAEKEFRKAVEGMTIGGSEVLTLLGTGIPASIASHLKEAEKKAQDYFRERTGLSLPLNTSTFPFGLIEEEMESIVRNREGIRHVRKFEDRVKRARELKGMKGKVLEDVQDILVFDVKSAIVEFERKFGLHFPVLEPDGNRVILRGAAHLRLAGKKECERVDYSVGEGDNVVILTGANSGGKTTLLETIAQTVILAQMGLPVCAEEAVLPVFEELYFHSQKKALNAGAFEGFLRSFIPVVTGEKRKLILADELEAITELDAGARIIATVLSRVKESDSIAVVVSHMADEISARLNVRIDGIEAKGLDEEMNLIVERTPRPGYRARSTPELIVRRLYSLSSGKEKEVYDAILKSFSDMGEGKGGEEDG